MKIVIFTVEIETPDGITNQRCKDLLAELEEVAAKKGYDMHDAYFERTEA